VLTSHSKFDAPTLNEIRHILHSLFSPVPQFPLPISYMGLSANSREELRSRIRISVADEQTTVNDRHGNGDVYGRHRQGPFRGGLRDSYWRGRTAELERKTPCPVITYAHSGCVYSDHPEVILVDKDVVEVMDDFAKERLGNIERLLDAGVDCEIGPDFDRNLLEGDWRDNIAHLAKDARAEADRASIAKDDDIADEDEGSETASIDEDDCVLAAVSAKGDSNSSVAAIEKNLESEAQTLLKAEKKRLEELLAKSSLMKGTYFKRCNGAFVNALADELSAEQTREAKVGHNDIFVNEKKIVPNDSAVRIAKRVEDDETLEEKPEVRSGPSTSSQSNAATTSPTSSKRSTLASTNGSPPDSQARSPSQSSSAKSSSKSSETSKEMASKIAKTLLPVLTKLGGHGYALLTGDSRESRSFSTQTLQAREQLVTTGQEPPSSFIVNSWAFNRLEKRRFASTLAKTHARSSGDEDEVDDGTREGADAKVVGEGVGIW
jgi:hypothetical protein